MTRAVRVGDSLKCERCRASFGQDDRHLWRLNLRRGRPPLWEREKTRRTVRGELEALDRPTVLRPPVPARRRFTPTAPVLDRDLPHTVGAVTQQLEAAGHADRDPLRPILLRCPKCRAELELEAAAG
jgi:hypothetical protein